MYWKESRIEKGTNILITHIKYVETHKNAYRIVNYRLNGEPKGYVEKKTPFFYVNFHPWTVSCFIYTDGFNA